MVQESTDNPVTSEPLSTDQSHHEIPRSHPPDAHDRRAEPRSCSASHRAIVAPRRRSPRRDRQKTEASGSDSPRAWVAAAVPLRKAERTNIFGEGPGRRIDGCALGKSATHRQDGDLTHGGAAM